ncbi:hypothetical protein NQ317_011757 [Molorchus minor]|uniref:THAP-type domain-containing protein n=1 Tax=Molorchus minor TaxID=1323400 RepID=A0ABQ9JUJ8_9CUCU|nr:hypothetical protein NQ317_011757 [Molorchus minor]
MSKRRFSGVVCCVVNCRNKQSNTKNISFYSFSTKPHKAEQREKWIKAVRRINADGSLWQPNKYTKICSAHFIDNVKSEHPLSPSFVPTIFPPCYLNSNPSEKSILNAKRRFQKCLAAGINKAIIPKSIKKI